MVAKQRITGLDYTFPGKRRQDRRFTEPVCAGNHRCTGARLYQRLGSVAMTWCTPMAIDHDRR